MRLKLTVRALYDGVHPLRRATCGPQLQRYSFGRRVPMPHTTLAYPFEEKVGQFAGELSSRCSSESSLRSLLIVFARNGNVLSVSFEDGSSNWQERVRALNTSGTPYLFYDPLEDGMEYIWLSWQDIEQSVMERLIGQRFEEADFLPMRVSAGRARKLVRENQFPQSWGVMF